MHSIKISVATKADVAAIAQLFDAYRQFYQYPSDFALASGYIAERIEKAESVILLAQDVSGPALGFCQLYPTFCSLEAKPIYALYYLYVAPAARARVLVTYSCWLRSKAPESTVCAAWI